MLYCFKLARLDFLGWIPLKLEYLPCRHAITKISELTGYHSPTVKKMKICCDICFINMGVVMYLP